MKAIKINDRIRYIPEEKIIITSRIALDDNDWTEFLNSKVDFFNNDTNIIPEKKYYKFENAFPTSAGILLTNKCPLKCSYCFYNSGEGDNTTLDPFKINIFVKQLVKNALMTKIADNTYSPAVTIILTGGGEPTADFDLLKYCVNTIKTLCTESCVKSYIHLVTNGITTKEVAQFIVNNIDSCNISFDGLPELQNDQRPMGSGKKSVEYVLRTASFFDEMNYDYGIRTTITYENYNKMIKMADYVYSTFKNLTQWQIEPVYSGGRASNNHFEHLFGFGNYFRALTEYSLQKYGKYPINSNLTYKLTSNYCSTSIGTNYWLDAYGDIIPCAEHFDKSKYRIAHFDSNRIVVDNNNHDELFANYEERMLKGCSNCVALYHCAGGCPMRMARNENGNLISEYGQYSCMSTKSYWMDAITNLAEEHTYSEMIPELYDQISFNNSTMKIIKIKTYGENYDEII